MLADDPERLAALDRDFLAFARRANTGPPEGPVAYPYELPARRGAAPLRASPRPERRAPFRCMLATMLAVAAVCGPSGAATLAQSDVARVFVSRGAARGCVRSRRGSWRLGVADRVTEARVAGRYALLGRPGEVLTVYDLRPPETPWRCVRPRPPARVHGGAALPQRRRRLRRPELERVDGGRHDRGRRGARTAPTSPPASSRWPATCSRGAARAASRCSSRTAIRPCRGDRCSAAGSRSTSTGSPSCARGCAAGAPFRSGRRRARASALLAAAASHSSTRAISTVADLRARSRRTTCRSSQVHEYVLTDDGAVGCRVDVGDYPLHAGDPLRGRAARRGDRDLRAAPSRRRARVAARRGRAHRAAASPWIASSAC